MVRKFNVPAFTTYCGLGAERIGSITAISSSCANPFARWIAIPGRSSAQPFPSSSTSSPQFERPKTMSGKMALLILVLKIAISSRIRFGGNSLKSRLLTPSGSGVFFERRHSVFSLSSKASGRSFLKRRGIIAIVSDFRAFASQQYAWWDGEISSVRFCQLSFLSSLTSLDSFHRRAFIAGGHLEHSYVMRSRWLVREVIVCITSSVVERNFCAGEAGCELIEIDNCNECSEVMTLAQSSAAEGYDVDGLVLKVEDVSVSRDGGGSDHLHGMVHGRGVAAAVGAGRCARRHWHKRGYSLCGGRLRCRGRGDVHLFGTGFVVFVM
ncbi:hypothetical protein EVAR_53024_1 [Eumeta japonica]|uniref:Uncharacterized protein n=1 Tax=Eumeta variegata TaxID=151549 RepID=A0A4C1XQP7_EUMVA|nr:hypothetical protein EVAR_53024_1 [Eumeta japonica]